MAHPDWAPAAEVRERLADRREKSTDATGHLSPTAFEFVLPGVRRGEVDRRLGKPYISSSSVVVKGQIDLFVDALTAQRSEGDKPRPTEDVHYYEYRPRQHSSEFARIVFRGDNIWYAMLPPHSGERTRGNLIAYHGDEFEEQKLHRGRHVLSVDVILWFRKKGLAFIEKPGRGITHRVVFPAEP